MLSPAAVSALLALAVCAGAAVKAPAPSAIVRQPVVARGELLSASLHGGHTATWQECQARCAADAACTAFDWTHVPDVCRPLAEQADPELAAGEQRAVPLNRFKFCTDCPAAADRVCHLRRDGLWEEHLNTPCLHVSGGPSATNGANKTVSFRSPLGKQPNVVFILTDDQDRILGQDDYTDIGSLETMPKLQKYLMQQGAFLHNFLVTTPICCPSRTESFSGRYYHNIGPPRQPGSCMHVNTSNAVAPGGLFGLFQQAGYQTGVFGKVTNDQTKVLAEATKQNTMGYIDSPINYNDYNGLTWWRKLANETTSTTEKVDSKNPVFGSIYQTSQISNRTLRWLDTVDVSKPFFAYLGPHAPHYPATPADWYAGELMDVHAPVTPNYNVSSPGKTQHIRQNPPFTAAVKCWEDEHMRDRWRTLLSVDDLIEDVVLKLEAMGVLDNTYIFYTSDHGYKLGQWRVGTSKQHPFETDLHVPMLVRGPGIRANSSFAQLSGNIDLLPTMVEIALGAAAVPTDVDGHSMAAFLVTEGEPGARLLSGRAQAAAEARAAGAALAPAVAAAGGPGAAWREHIIVEYLSVGTYFNDHSSIAHPATDPSCSTKGPPKGPGATPPNKCVEETGVGAGQCYFVDSELSNSWRALRILNAEQNMVYIEYDHTWQWNTTDPSGAGLQFYELYDIAADKYQVSNIYGTASPALRTQLHQAMAQYYDCGGSVSNCP